MSTKNLSNQEAYDKLKELAESIDYAMFETNLGARPTHVIPMSTKKCDQEGSLWFLSNKDSDNNSFIHKDKDVQLLYSKPTAMEYMSIYGQAFIYNDLETIKKLYTTSDDAWFNGPTDPNITAIKVVPQEAHYWDTKDGMITTLFKMGLGALTGNKQDLGESGDLDL